MHPAYTRDCLIYWYPFSLEERDNNVGSAVNVGKFEKSPENFPRKVFQNAYINYTTYTDIGLELRQWLDPVPLHKALMQAG